MHLANLGAGSVSDEPGRNGYAVNTVNAAWCERLLDGLTDYAIFLVDEDGRIRTWHPGVRAIFGYGPAEFVGQPLGMIYTAEDRASGAVTRDLREAAEHGRSGDDQWHVRKDGSRFFVFGLLAAIRDEDGALRGFAKIVRDRSDHMASVRRLESARQRADEASHEKDAFMAVLAHELRAPLSAIRGWIQMLIGGAVPPDRATTTLQRVIRSTERMVRLVDDLADASRILAGTLPLQQTPVDLVAVVRHAVAELAAAAAEKQLAVNVETEACPTVQGDRVRLAQVAGNLLSNAIKYTPPGGQVRARLRCSADTAILTVSDTGRGIGTDDLPHVFERFRRSRDAERREPGLGLGLWITRELVSAHGGSISVASGGIGLGATVTVQLPLASGISASQP